MRNLHGHNVELSKMVKKLTEESLNSVRAMATTKAAFKDAEETCGKHYRDFTEARSGVGAAMHGWLN